MLSLSKKTICVSNTAVPHAAVAPATALFCTVLVMPRSVGTRPIGSFLTLADLLFL
jgi:hypothetical protein